jgi:23S rRNA pseudouridine2457 synthase
MFRQRVVLLNKPFRVLSQFTDKPLPLPGGGEQLAARQTLSDFIAEPLHGTGRLRPAGRLDYDSEGLLVLTDDRQLQQRVTHPQHQLWKTYWLQVEGVVSPRAVEWLAGGVQLKDGPTRPARVRAMAAPPEVWAREPPIRHREKIPTSWLEVSICEGRNRQLRRMSAAVGFPTLRLIRVAIGGWKLGGLRPGESVEVAKPLAAARAARARGGRGGGGGDAAGGCVSEGWELWRPPPDPLTPNLPR